MVYTNLLDEDLSPAADVHTDPSVLGNPSCSDLLNGGFTLDPQSKDESYKQEGRFGGTRVGMIFLGGGYVDIGSTAPYSGMHAAYMAHHRAPYVPYAATP